MLDEFKSKPWYKSVTILLGVLVAILPAVVEFIQQGKFDTAAIISGILGIAVILRRLFGEPTALTAK